MIRKKRRRKLEGQTESQVLANNSNSYSFENTLFSTQIFEGVFDILISETIDYWVKHGKDHSIKHCNYLVSFWGIASGGT